MELQDQNATQQAEAAVIIENLHAENHKNIEWAQEIGRKLEEKSDRTGKYCEPARSSRGNGRRAHAVGAAPGLRTRNRARSH